MLNHNHLHDHHTSALAKLFTCEETCMDAIVKPVETIKQYFADKVKDHHILEACQSAEDLRAFLQALLPRANEALQLDMEEAIIRLDHEIAGGSLLC